MAAFYNGTKQPPLESWEACKADPSHILVHHLALCTECTQLRNKSCGYQTDAACTHLCHASWHKFVPTLLTVFWSQLAGACLRKDSFKAPKEEACRGLLPAGSEESVNSRKLNCRALGKAVQREQAARSGPKAPTATFPTGKEFT